MTVRAFYRLDTGDLVSVGSVWAAQIDPSLGWVEMADMPDINALMWDKATRAFVARPAKVLIDRIQDMLTDPNYADWQTVYNAQSAQRKNTIQNVLGRLLGNQRFRAAGERLEL